MARENSKQQLAEMVNYSFNQWNPPTIVVRGKERATKKETEIKR